MNDYQQRVIEEQKELTDKLTKLIVFCNSPDYTSLPYEEKERLFLQQDIMRAYSRVLLLRIQAFK